MTKQDQLPRDSVSPVLITGSSGFIGGRLVRNIAERRVPVVAMYYHRLPDAVPNVFPICSDMSSPELLATPLRGVETVYHLAWDSSSANGSERDVTWEVDSNKLPKNVQVARNLFAAMERAGTKRLILVSSIGAKRTASERFLREKYLTEFYALNSKIPERIIVRPSVVFGRDGQNDPFVRSIVRVMRFPIVYPVPCSKGLLAPIDVEDLVKVLATLHTAELKQPCAMLEVTGAEAYKVSDVFRLVSARYAKGARIPLPGALGNSLLSFFERDSRKGAVAAPKLRDYLVLASKGDREINDNNPMVGVLPKHMHSFREVVGNGPNRI